MIIIKMMIIKVIMIPIIMITVMTVKMEWTPFKKGKNINVSGMLTTTLIALLIRNVLINIDIRKRSTRKSDFFFFFSRRESNPRSPDSESVATTPQELNEEKRKQILSMLLPLSLNSSPSPVFLCLLSYLSVRLSGSVFVSFSLSFSFSACLSVCLPLLPKEWISNQENSNLKGKIYSELNVNCYCSLWINFCKCIILKYTVIWVIPNFIYGVFCIKKYGWCFWFTRYDWCNSRN